MKNCKKKIKIAEVKEILIKLVLKAEDERASDNMKNTNKLGSINISAFSYFLFFFARLFVAVMSIYSGKALLLI